MTEHKLSRAVVERRNEAHDSLDDFPTPPWATRALVEHVLIDRVYPWANPLKNMRVWEPACNRGYMARPLAEYFGAVVASDVHNYGDSEARQCDFLIPGTEPPSIAVGGAHWIITNPPFRLAEPFLHRALTVKNCEGVALLVRTSFLESVGRWNSIYSQCPPSIVAQFVERVPMVKGRLSDKAVTATAYCWLVWLKGDPDANMMWIPPCRKQLERAGDYPGV